MAAGLADVGEPVAEPEAEDSGRRRGGQSPIEADELVGLGELGLLPSLLQSFGTGIDCDFDDALSTCQ